jgi:2-polyprenyl-3-methyl-5-hydroxy-6-metoxy-1,4-benzoquinol methylase
MTDVRARAEASGGASGAAIHALVEQALVAHDATGGFALDVGCGRGDLARRLRDRFARYVGTDVVRYDEFPSDLEFVKTDLDNGRVPLPDAAADAVICAETIEHVENPRALVRELVRLTRPGGWVVVTTPNQLSLSSKLCLLTRGQFLQFQEAPGLYPAHITALLETDLVRMARECELERIEVTYTGSGRVPFTARYWPAVLNGQRGWRGRAFSDNVLLCGRRPASASGGAAY